MKADPSAVTPDFGSISVLPCPIFEVARYYAPNEWPSTRGTSDLHHPQVTFPEAMQRIQDLNYSNVQVKAFEPTRFRTSSASSIEQKIYQSVHHKTINYYCITIKTITFFTNRSFGVY